MENFVPYLPPFLAVVFFLLLGVLIYFFYCKPCKRKEEDEDVNKEQRQQLNDPADSDFVDKKGSNSAEKFRPSIRYFPEIIKVAQRMTTAANILKIPVIATEQYPKGLGSTVEEIDTSFFKEQIYPKTKFSMVIPEVEEQLKQLQVENVVLMGIETQVCVLQTTMDLLERNYTVHVLADGVSSRTMVERMFALERIRQIGGFVTTSECTLFMLMGDSKHPNFKEVQALVKTAAPDSGLLSKC